MNEMNHRDLTRLNSWSDIDRNWCKVKYSILHPAKKEFARINGFCSIQIVHYGNLLKFSPNLLARILIRTNGSSLRFSSKFHPWGAFHKALQYFISGEVYVTSIAVVDPKYCVWKNAWRKESQQATSSLS